MKTQNQVSTEDKKIETPLKTDDVANLVNRPYRGLKPMKSMARVKSIKPAKIVPSQGRQRKLVKEI